MILHNNCCTFPKIIDGRMAPAGHPMEKCGLYYQTLSELIHHIEEEHIPLIEAIKTAERKQLKEKFANDPEQYEKAYAALINQPVPLSLICKMKPFPKGHKVQPIPPPKPRTLRFCHYKPKPQIIPMQTQPDALTDFGMGTTAAVGSPDYTTTTAGAGRQQPIKSISQKLVENQSRIRQISTSTNESVTNDFVGLADQQPLATGPEEKKFRCGHEGCTKTYKNQQGLRHHMRSAHNLSLDGTQIGTKLSASEEGILSRQLLGRQSPFVANAKLKQPESAIESSISSARSTEKYKCQQCNKEYKGIKAFANYNKHLHEVHQIIISSPSRYPSPSPIPHVYSSQTSPQRPISTGNITILSSASSKMASTQHHQQQPTFQSQTSNFVAPTLTARNQQQSSFISHQTSRPSAPIPPSTPPSASVGIQQQSSIVGYSPIHQQQQTATTIIRPQQSIENTSPQRQQHVSLADQHHQEQQPQHTQMNQPQSTPPQQHYYVTTMDQQPPPILQPQQQPTTGGTPTSARYHRYAPYQQQQPTQQIVQQRQPTAEQQMQQQIYGGNYAGTYPQVQLNPGSGGTTTIYVTHQQANLGTSPMGGPQQQNFGGIQQPHVLEYEHQQQIQDNYNRPYYRQQTHYTVEPIQQQQQQIYPQQINQLSPRSTPAATNSSIRIGSNNPQQFPQQQQTGTMTPQPQQQQHYQVYPIQHHSQHQPPPPPPHSPYITTIRTAPIQGPRHQQQQQRIYQHQAPQQQFYTLSRSHSHNQSQRQSPATVEAILGRSSPAAQQDGYVGMHQSQQKQSGFTH